MTRRLLATLLVVAVGFAFAARADDPAKADPKSKAAKDGDAIDPKVAREEAAIRQEQLARQFRDFEAALLRLAQRLSESSRPEDKEKAATLKKAIEKASTEGIDTKFERLVKELKDKQSLNLEDLEKARAANRDLSEDIRAIIAILMSDTRDEELRRQIRELTEMLKRINQLIREEQTVRAWTERGTMDKDRLEREQRQVRQSTEDLVKGQGKQGEGRDAREDRGQAKPGNSKDGQPGEARNDTKDPKGENRDGKPGEGKEGKPGEAREGKPGESKEGKPGEAREGKPGESKEGKPGEARSTGKPEEAQENKPAEARQAGQPGENKENQPGEARAAGKEGQPGASKADTPQGENKGRPDNKAASKGQSGQQGQPGSQSQQQGQSKGQGQGQQQQQAQGKGDPQQQQQQAGNQQQPNDAQARKRIQDAIENMKGAEEEIKKPNLPDASAKQDQAIKDLKDAARRLEELLKQLRHEEIERILAALQARCERMLAMQIEVRDGTINVYQTIDKLPEKKPTRNEEQKSLQLSDREEEIVGLATKAIELLKAEGTAVAFPEVFMQLRDDMMTVANRLRKTDVGPVTQAIEYDIIETLKEMIEALKRARQENQQQQQNPNQQQQQQGQPQDQKLIELLHELKMIRSMQLRVNERTKLYGREYQGEQAPSPTQLEDPAAREKAAMIQKELKNLAERQEKIFEVTNNIARGKNK
ncbi:MAG TPA: hypothetical protein VNK04_23490 [Gemmataceae bacterium]|nr:hypothetical protein [Gemmataceae bacterium]